MTRDPEQGSVTAFVTVVAVALVLVAGMAYDGGEVVAGQARARGAADGAARTGAQEIDITHLRSTGEAVLDPAAAVASAEEYLARTGIAGDAVVVGADITVTVTLRQPLRILPGPDRIVTVTETATAVTGPAS
jgi:Flp pilus assembly protein TadG